jgi:hypothetical protein
MKPLGVLDELSCGSITKKAYDCMSIAMIGTAIKYNFANFFIVNMGTKFLRIINIIGTARIEQIESAIATIKNGKRALLQTSNIEILNIWRSIYTMASTKATRIRKSLEDMNCKIAFTFIPPHIHPLTQNVNTI